MTNTRISHTGHNHPNTTAARTACRKAMKATPATVAPVIDTPAGPVAVGDTVEVLWRGDRYFTYAKVTLVSEDIKNGRPGMDVIDQWGQKRWMYAKDVVRRVVGDVV